jgi:predicted metal-binding protein
MNDQKVLSELTRLAEELGATEARAIMAANVTVEDHLAELCLEPGCENYGLSAGCPPHVAGPSAMREMLARFSHALVFKIDVPSEMLFSNARPELFTVLHEIAAEIEHRAVEMGCRRSKAFAGGSCKQLFCADHAGCRVVAEGGACRNPRRARPSMSGFGVNVSKLMAAAGWPMHRAAPGADPAEGSIGTLSGMVLIG